MVYSEPERAHFEKRSTFIEAVVVGAGNAPREPDHELVWVNSEAAALVLSHQSQCWAIEQWLERLS